MEMRLPRYVHSSLSPSLSFRHISNVPQSRLRRAVGFFSGIPPPPHMTTTLELCLFFVCHFFLTPLLSWQLPFSLREKGVEKKVKSRRRARGGPKQCRFFIFRPAERTPTLNTPTPQPTYHHQHHQHHHRQYQYHQH